MDCEMKLMKKKLKVLLKSDFLGATRQVSQYRLKLDWFSDKFREDGNTLFLKKKHSSGEHEKILILYNQSIAYATEDSESLAKAYANKSALLRHIGKYTECISEIDKASRIANSDSLRVKLFCRKVECLSALDSPKNQANLEDAKHFLDKLEESDNIESSLKEFIKKTQLYLKEEKTDLPKQDGKRREIMNLIAAAETIDTSNFVEVNYSEKFGMHLVAARDFKAGEIIIIEKPHCKVANVTHSQSYIHCGYCTQYLWNCVPCDHCTWCMFCSEQCKNQAWEEYHDIECGVIACILDLEDLELFSVPLLSLRIFLRALRQAGSVVQLRADVETLDIREDYKSFFAIGENESYKRFYSLQGAASPEELESYSETFSKIVVILAKYSLMLGKSYEFHQNSKLVKNEMAITAGALLLKTCKIVCLHGQSIWESNEHSCLSKEVNNGGPCKSQCCGKKACFVSTWSAISLSCCPNVSRCFISNDRATTFTLSPVKKGDQLFTSIHSIYEYAPKSERQKLYRERYDRDCDCEACSNDWTEEDFSTEETIKEDAMHEKQIMQKLEAPESNSTKKRSPEIEKLFQMKEVVQDAWKYFTLPSKLVVETVRGLIDIVDVIYAIPWSSNMPNECSN